MTQTKKTTDLSTQAVNLINFHGLTLWVAEHDGIEYVPARPLVDLAGIQWKGAKKRFFTASNEALFGSKELNDPIFNEKKDVSGIAKGNKLPKKQVYIRLDRARMYLARINTDHMRSKDNKDAADKLLALQIEWAEVLHKYELGQTINKPQQGEVRSLTNLITARDKCKDIREQEALSLLIKRKISLMGAEMPPMPQQEMQI